MAVPIADNTADEKSGKSIWRLLHIHCTNTRSALSEKNPAEYHIVEKGGFYMTDFLVRHFVPNYSAVENTAVRTSYGILAGVTGIFCYFLLFAI